MKLFICMLLVLGCLASMSAEKKLLLTSGKKAALPIVIARNASKGTREVAEFLASYLEKASGAKFQIRTGDGSFGIVLGTLAEFPTPALVKPLEIRNYYNGREAFSIRTGTKRLQLIGATEKGVSHAAFRLLEHLGFRQFFPMPEWEVTPSLPTIAVNLNLDDRPALLFRRIWAGEGWLYPNNKPLFDRWRRFNLADQSLSIWCGHSWPSIIGENKATFDAHPEYASLVNGKRTTNADGQQLCVSNPAVRKLVTEWVMEYIKKYPATEMVSLEPNDGGNYCDCENCRKLGSESNQVYDLANEVARALNKAYPGKMIGLYAYGGHSAPPGFPIEPNIYVQLTRGFNTSSGMTYDDLLAAWSKTAKNFGEYEYYTVYVWDYDRPPLTMGADIRYIKQCIDQVISVGGTSIDCESGTNWGPYGRGYYIANRLMWNPRVDVQAVLEDFYAKAFGPAAAPMKRWYERFDPGNSEFIDENCFALAFRDLQAASNLAKNRPDVMARLGQLKQYMQYVRLRWKYDQETDKAKRKQLVFEILRHLYRIQGTHMVHTWAYLNGWTTGVAQEYGEPTWSFQEPTQPKPYALDKPYTPGEVDQLFQEGLHDFKAVELLPQKTYSTDLVPVQFKNSAPAAWSQMSQFGFRHAFYIVKDEPFEFDIIPGLTYPGKPPANLSAVDAKNGKTVFEMKLPPDQKERHVTITVPHPGLYYLDNDAASCFRVTFPPEARVEMVLARKQFYLCGTQQPIYFYVPKGTKEFQYYITSACEYDLVRPDGRTRHMSTLNGYVTVPVAPGMDGQVWCMRNTCIGYLWFRNLPNYYAPSPNALLLPGEVLKTDGLESPRTGEK